MGSISNKLSRGGMSHFTSSYLAFRFKLQNLKSQDPEKKLVNGMALAHPTLYTCGNKNSVYTPMHFYKSHVVVACFMMSLLCPNTAPWEIKCMDFILIIMEFALGPNVWVRGWH